MGRYIIIIVVVDLTEKKRIVIFFPKPILLNLSPVVANVSVYSLTFVISNVSVYSLTSFMFAFIHLLTRYFYFTV